MKANKPLDILVVGAGMYVCGRGTEGFGTILPALFEASQEGLAGKVTVAATSEKSIRELQKKVKKLYALFGKKLSVQGSSQSLQEIFDSGFSPDCAIVCVPDHLHFAVTSFLMHRGIHCLVVKPLAPTLKEVKDLIRLQGKKQVYGMVEFHKRYDRSNLKLRDVIRSGAIGDPLYFVVEYSQRKSIPTDIFKSWIKQTNIFQYLGIHYVDIIHFATGARPLRVMALGQKNYLKSQGIDAYDAIEGVIEWQMPSGKLFTSAILTNWIDPEQTSAMSDQKIKVIGTQGRYEADQKKRGILMVTDENGIEEPNPDFSAFYGNSFQGYGVLSIHQFLKDTGSIISGERSLADFEGHRPTFKDSIVPTAVIEAVNLSLKGDGKWVKIRS